MLFTTPATAKFEQYARISLGWFPTEDQSVKLFFASSQAFHTQLTALYDLVNPTAAAMWNLRWQVRGYLDQRPEVDNRELFGRFVTGSGIGSANLRRHCAERGWEEQIGELALLAIFGAIGLYEGWVASLEVGTADQRQRLQFPSRGVNGRTALGVQDTVTALQANPSTLINLAYGPVLVAHGATCRLGSMTC